MLQTEIFKFKRISNQTLKILGKHNKFAGDIAVKVALAINL